MAMRQLLQFTLDLFDTLAAPAPGRAPAKPRRLPKPRVFKPNQPSALVDIAQPAIDSVAFQSLPSAKLHGPYQSAVPLAPLLAPANFVHPRANRQALLDGGAKLGGTCVVAYELRRGKRRTIGFSVGPDGLTVSAPQWVPLHEVDAALREKTRWVIEKLGDARQRQQRQSEARIEWKDGAELPFLGQPLVLRLDARHGGAAVLLPATGEQANTLQIGLPPTATEAQVRDVVQAWLMRQAKRIFVERLDHFAPKLNVKWRKLSLSNAGTRWGSASADGSIRLNWRLIHYRLPIVDYVVAHELAHLRVMDHSPRFWDTVATVVPDYAQLRRQLKDDSVPRW